MDSRQHFTGFRVVVYRLRFPDNATLTKGAFSADKVFSSDFWHSDYDRYVTYINGTKTFSDEFIADTNRIISDMVLGGLLPTTTPTSSGTQFNSSFSSGTNPNYREIDITPIVTNINIGLSLEDQNTCSVTVADPSIAYLVDKSISDWIRRNNISTNQQKLLSDLRGFVFREFDLIRVYSYSSTSKSLTDRIAELKAAGIDSTTAYTPAFTGTVVSFARSVAPDDMPSVTANCMGISRVFIQSVTASTKAVADVVSSAEPNISTLTDAFSAFGTRFQSLTSDQVFEFLVSSYLHPLYLRSESLRESFLTATGETSDVKAPIIGVPDLRRFMSPDDIKTLTTYYPDAARLDGTGQVTDTYAYPSSEANMATSSPAPTSDPVPQLVPFLPMCVLLHILKTVRREPIAVFDDRLDGMIATTRFDDTQFPIGNTKVATTSGEDYGALKPYLEMVRTNYDIYDTSYVSAASLFSDIREKSFLEIFEDRTGAFHFRIPRYNMSRAYYVINPQDVISADIGVQDSSEYNAVITKRSIPLVGTTQDIPGDVYLDRLSIMRYGFRMPQIVENPNNASPTFSVRLSKFLRNYIQGKSARRATIVQLIDPSINVGDVVFFTYGPSYRYKIKNSGNDTAFQESTLVGYVQSISETMTASGAFTQSVELTFVRPAFPYANTTPNGAIGKSETVSQTIVTTDFSSSFANPSTKQVAQNISQVQSMAGTPFRSGFDSIGLWMIPSRVERQGINFSAKNVPEVRHLMEAASDPKVSDEVSTAQQRRRGRTPPLTRSGHDAATINLSNHVKFLGMKVLSGTVVDAFQKSVLQKSLPEISSPSASIQSVGSNLRTYFYDALASSIGSSGTVSFAIPTVDSNGVKGSIPVEIPNSVASTCIIYMELIHQLSRIYGDAKNAATDSYYNDWNTLFNGGGNSQFTPADRVRARELIQFAAVNLKGISSTYANAVSGDTKYAILDKQQRDWANRLASAVPAAGSTVPANRIASAPSESIPPHS